VKIPVVCRDLPIGRRMAMIVKLYQQAVKQRIACSAVGRNYAVLVYLSRKAEALSQQELVENLGIDKASMVRVLDELFAEGLIERQAHPNDRRSHQIVLTENGKAQLPAICEAVEAVNLSMMEGLSEDEQIQFSQSLERIQMNLQQMDKEKVRIA
jgi:MarR family transcriptional regulator, transcriptional regulator for hemolysin